MNDSKVARDGVGISVEVSKEHTSVSKRSINHEIWEDYFDQTRAFQKRKLHEIL